MDMNMKKFTVRRFFSVYLRKKSRSKSSSLSRFEVKSALTFVIRSEYLYVLLTEM